MMETYRRYFDGEVFRDTQPNEDEPYEGEKLLFPVGINLVKAMCLAQTDAAFGEWDDLPIKFEVRQDLEITEADKKAVELINQIMIDSNAWSMFWMHELERNVYGGAVMKIRPNLPAASHIRWDHIPRQCFFPIWDPDDPNRMLEVYLIDEITKEQAKAKYSVELESDTGKRIEHWTLTDYTTKLDDRRIDQYSGKNPWGIIPIVFTPRMRLSNWYGEALTAGLMDTQDELNARVADIGEAMSYNSHPIKWGRNLRNPFNRDNFPIGPDVLWDLGTTVGTTTPEPEVGMLEAKEAINEGAFKYIDFLYDWTRVISGAPPIAFGEDDGGGQRSGVTLEIRMWPLVKSVRRSRAFLTTTLMQMLRITAAVYKQKNFSDIPIRAIKSLEEGRIVPNYYTIMPRDHAALVNEIVSLLGTDPPSISLETVVSMLGRGPGEVDRISDMLADKGLWKTQTVHSFGQPEGKMDAQRKSGTEKTEGE